MRVVVTGGAGFIGSHLCDRLLARGDSVVAIDDLSTGSAHNVAHLCRHEGFTLLLQDVVGGIEVDGHVDAVCNLASPASPPRYLEAPLQTLRTGSLGTEHALTLAAEHGARFVQASTSEVYGDPFVHPQPESYWGNVNPIGPRAVYDEAKRYGEALVAAYRRERNVDTAIARIFNTYGPRLDPYDGRVVSTFIRQVLDGEPLTVFGDGTQTRSFCYVDDLVRGLVSLLDGDEPGPINLGNPVAFTMLELAEEVFEVAGASVPVVFEPLPEDDPKQRQPDITLARERLGWQPEVPLREGLERTIAWFADLRSAPAPLGATAIA